MNNILRYLKKHFGYDSLREGQLPTIQSILNGEKSLTVLSTGKGKSLCYQLPAAIMEGTMVVISPLIALMNDQVKACEEANISAIAFHSGNDAFKQNKFISLNDWSVIFISPETALSLKFQQVMRETEINTWVFDEVHTLEMWGETFRPKYKELAVMVQDHSKRTGSNIACFTASATPDMREYIKDSLGMKGCNEFVSSVYRHELNLFIKPKTDTFMDEIVKAGKSGMKVLVYCQTRAETEKVTRTLRAKGLFDTYYYHAGTAAEYRTFVETGFKGSEITIVVCTIAFGMGVDIPDIRFVFHVNAPASIEAYLQETGRAGRDGGAAECTMFLDKIDFVKHISMNAGSNADKENKEKNQQRIGAMMRLASSNHCLWGTILEYFGEDYKECGGCSNCLKEV